MGLCATVFRNKANLQLGSDQTLALEDTETGEVYFEDASIERKYAAKRIAASRYFGNIAAIGSLRDEVTSKRGSDSFIVRRVLFSGSHSGDLIAVGELHTLSTEIRAIRASGTPSEELTEFLSSLEDLVRCAHTEGNPIVFT